nr:MAG TPA: tail tape measure [Caudoviricetes sp.]
MGTVIDELIVALRLDPKDFTKGQKEAGSAFLKTRDDAIKSGKEVEAASNKVAASIQKMAREVITLFTAFAGARSLKDLVAGLTTANAELGRFSANMAESPQQIAAWSAAAQRFGGTGQATADTIQRMGKALYDLRFQGKALPQAFYQLEAATGRLIDTDKGPLAFLEQTSAALKELAERDPSRAFNIGQELGLDQGTYNLMVKQGAAIHEFVAGIEKSISPSNKAIEAAQKLQTAWATFVQQMGAAANRLYETLGGPISKLIDKLTEWLKLNEQWITSGITDAVKQFADALAKIDWAGVSNGFGNFSKAAADTAASFKAIVDAIAVMSTWFTGTPLKAPDANPNWERDWKEKLGGKGAADLPVEAPLNSRVLREWENGSVPDAPKPEASSNSTPSRENDWAQRLLDWWNGKTILGHSQGANRGETERGNSLNSFLGGPDERDASRTTISSNTPTGEDVTSSDRDIRVQVDVPKVEAQKGIPTPADLARGSSASLGRENAPAQSPVHIDRAPQSVATSNSKEAISPSELFAMAKNLLVQPKVIKPERDDADIKAQRPAQQAPSPADRSPIGNLFEQAKRLTTRPDAPKAALERDQKLAAGLDGMVDGRPVSRGNPLPVTPISNESSGGGFWSDLWKGVTSAMSGASAGLLGSGGSLMSAGANGGMVNASKSHDNADQGKAAATVPDVPGMTADERNKLGLILKYESRGRNVMNYMGRNQGLDPATAKGYTAQGYYQMLNSNWRRLAPKLGIFVRNAMAASLEDQTKVALALMRESGIGNWANFNPSLKRALQRGEQAGEWAKRVPAPVVPQSPIGIATGAKASAAISSANNDNRRYSNNNVSSNMSIGTMNVQTQASDAHGIADVIWGDIDQRMKQSANATAANYGPT